jgi:hypothetical protein
MYCNSLNLHSEYFWLFLSALWVGIALAAGLRYIFSRLRLKTRLRLKKRDKGFPYGARTSLTSPLVRISLSLTLAFVAVLGGLFFIDLPGVSWSQQHLYFFLIAGGAGLLLRLFLRFLAVPVVVTALAYIFLVSTLCQDWIPAVPGRLLAEVKVLSVEEDALSLELKLPGKEGGRIQGVYRLEGKKFADPLPTLQFPAWSFYPGVNKFFLLEGFSGERENPSAEGKNSSPGTPQADSAWPSSPPARIAQRLCLVRYGYQELYQPELFPLRVYGLFYDGRSERFFIRLLE